MCQQDFLLRRRGLSRLSVGALVLGLVGSLLAVGQAHAATFVVDDVGDGADSAPGNGSCRAAGNVCTLRAAIEEANALGGAHVINFNIAPAGPKTITPGSALPNITASVTIDGTTQPGFAGNPVIELNGAVAGGHALSLAFAGSSGSTIRGLVINRFTGAAIRALAGSSNNIIAGNYLGTDLTGTLARGNQVGVFLQASNNRIGGTTTADRNIISGNTLDGIQINGAAATGNVVEGNYVGLDSTGTAGLGNATQGVAIFGNPTNNTIGGTAAGAGNVISGNGNDGVLIANAGTTGNRVEGNFIGTDAAGTTAIGNLRGVEIDASANGNTIGGTAAGASNRIAHNVNGGCELTPTAGTGNRINSNEIFSNGTLGIDLGENGVTPNDAGDGDGGPNNQQNYPVLSAAMTNGAGSANFAGSLNSAATTTYRIEFFASSAADPTGFGEGQRYLGFTNVTTNAAGNAVIGVTLATSLTAGELVTATATDSSNNTSEFSAALLSVASLVVTTTADISDGNTASVSALIAAPGADGRISLREAILAANATGGADTIGFGIPLTDANHLYYQNDAIAGSLTNVQPTTLPDSAITDFDPDYVGTPFGWYRIRPTSALPTVSGALVLDGYTQSGAQANSVAAPGVSNAVVNIELDGSLAGAVNGLTLTAGNSTIQGLVINRFGQDGIDVSSGGSNTIAGNYVGTDVTGTVDLGNLAKGFEVWSSNNTIGGTTAGARNLISGNQHAGIQLRNPGATGNLVAGNFIGTDVTGAVDLGNSEDGVRFSGGASGNTIGGTSAGARNVISGNDNQGITFWDATNANNLIQGNYIGVNAAGTAAVGNGTLVTPWGGVGIDGTNTTLGGTAPGAGNVISGNLGAGIEVYSSGHTIQGNFIGTNASGTAGVANTTSGVILFPASNTRIGGTAGGAGNRIAFNGDRGLRLETTAGTGNAVLGNEIYSNGSLAIDLNADGVTANDASDTDAGPNDLLNFPFITSVQGSGGTLTVYYKLDVPAGSYRIEFFKNPSGADPTGYGEGEVFASSTSVTHPGGGSVNLNHSFAGAVGEVITATTTLCTDGATCTLFGSTSELSNAFTAVPTAVRLTSFTAAPRAEAVDLFWNTASELNNLGFHLYRSLSLSGPFERITEVPIPGLGSSPVGASYSHRDTGLSNGVTYFYRLEDIETTGRTTLHGPVWATPKEDAGASGDGEASDEPRVAHGDPGEVSLRVLEWSVNGALIDLVTGGFFATTSTDGTVRLEVPGFEEIASPGSPALPVKKAWLDAVAGRGVRIVSVQASEVTRFAGWRPASASFPEIVASREGTLQARLRRARSPWRGPGVFPSSAARVVETGFQEEVKKALLELAPLRWDGDSGQLLWARRLRVRLSFAGVVASELYQGGSRGRGHREEKTHLGRRILAQIATSRAGLYRVRFEEIFGARSGGLSSQSLRLSRLGEAVPYHLEPSVDRFGPGSVLYFVSPGEASNPYSNEAVYELEFGSGGRTMPVEDVSPSGPPVGSYLHRREWEQNRYYQAGLLQAPSLWLWDFVLSPGSKSYPFALGPISEEEAELEVYLQGASDFEAAPDHHVRVSVNGTPVGETSWDGKPARTIQVPVAAGVPRHGENEISVENLGDTGALYSMVFLDRFSLTYRRQPVAEAGVLEGSFRESGTVSVGGLAEGSLLLQTSPEMTWLRGAIGSAASVSFHAESGRSYLAVSPEAVLEGKVRKPPATGLRRTGNRADYLLIGPREFLDTAKPLLERRRMQALVSRGVAIEEVFDEFGYGEARPEALKEFLEYAYHHWRQPSVRYVVLFGDATYDGKDNLGTGVVNRVPAFPRKTSYLWTASDPSYASVNGEDGLPDLAVGRLPAATVAEARVLVEKVLAYEESGQDLSGRAVFVADNPDAAGDFERDTEEIASGLVGREVDRIYLRQLGVAGTRSAIVQAFDGGASLLSYAGHGGIALWASENVFRSSDVGSLRLQARQPIVMTMNCLNGYFHFPYFDSLAEALIKADGKGAIAAFSPSGLSLNAPAHLYHQALVDELTSGRHARLGDAVLQAQKTYAESGAFPELLSIYHLFGDPALELR